MFPIRDHNPSNKTPFVCNALIAANIIVFALYAPLLSDQTAAQTFFFEYGLVSARISAGDGYMTFLTSMYLHGGLLHLGGNMLFLYIFGDNLEEDLGHLGFFVFYTASGLGAAFAQYVAAPASLVPMVGASGAIAGVMGGYLLFYPRARVDVLFIFVIIIRIVPLPAWLMLGVWFGIQLFSGAISSAALGGVAYWAHAGGFIVGLILLLPGWLRRGGPAFWAATHGHPDNPAATYRRVPTSVPKAGRRR